MVIPFALLAIWGEETLRLLDVGGHEVVRRYNKQKFFVDVHQNIEASSEFWPESQTEQGFFIRSPERAFTLYGPEALQAWLYFLSDQQAECVADVLEHSLPVIDSNLVSPVFILGGPGTGKTSVLLNLLRSFFDLGLEVDLVMEPVLAKYVDACLTDVAINRFLIPRNAHSGANVVLVDDPNSIEEISAVIPKKDKSELVVIAFDPCQMVEGFSDEVFSEYVRESAIELFSLDVCYRQKENVGKAVKKIIDTIAESTPFLTKEKIQQHHEQHRHMTAIANDLDFINPFGYVEVYSQTTIENILSEVERIRSKPLWKHWEPLLVVVQDDSFNLSEATIDALSLVNYQIISLLAVEKAKGLEYQHAFIFISETLYNELENGFKGAGQRRYNERRLLRIPFSRSKDSVVTFVING